MQFLVKRRSRRNVLSLIVPLSPDKGCAKGRIIWGVFFFKVYTISVKTNSDWKKKMKDFSFWGWRLNQSQNACTWVRCGRTVSSPVTTFMHVVHTSPLTCAVLYLVAELRQIKASKKQELASRYVEECRFRIFGPQFWTWWITRKGNFLCENEKPFNLLCLKKKKKTFFCEDFLILIIK